MAEETSQNQSNEPDVTVGGVGVESSQDTDRQTQPIDAEQPPRLPFPVVGVGASAGGLEAFTAFLSEVRPDSGMAYVFIQHLPPTGESMLVDILSKRTDLPVMHVDEGLKVEPNKLYVIRPGQTLTIGNGVFHLGERLATPMHNRPVDDFFKSLAEEQRERGIAIIMSGMGSNGTAGAQAVKAVGGLCIAQDPETTDYPSMPRHLIDAGYADYILRPQDIPAVLAEYAGHPYTKGQREEKAALAKRDQQHLREILAILRARTHQDFNGYKKPTVLRRIQRRMGLNRLTKIGDYARLLRQTPAEVTALSDDLLIHVTGFFRDAAAWESLRQRIIVPLIESRSHEDSVRCWVTACSSGEEAYTLSMLLMEESERTNKSLDIKVFATDTAERTLQNARNGIYTGGIESEITPERLERFFIKEDSVYRVRPELRECVVFAPQNLLQDPPFSRLDIVSCRNLLIYLEPEMQARILALLHFGLREGGTLFLGTSETVNSADLFEPIDKPSRIYRRIGPTRHVGAEFPMPRAIGRTLSRAFIPISPRTALPRPSLQQMMTHALVEYHTPAAVIIDRDHRIVFYHGNTQRFLTIPRGEPTRELLDVVRDTLRGAVRIAVQRATSSQKPATILDGWMETEPGQKVRIAITASPLDPRHAPNHLVVSFQELGEPLPQGESSTTKKNGDERDGEEIRRMRAELQSTIEELQTSNEELKASHEEVVSTNEELQTTNEELETSREEMQSLNEELNTVNAQLRVKIEEHQAASNDLSCLLTSTDIAVLFLDPRLRIRRFTPAIRDLLDLIPADVGRPLADLARKFSDPNLESDARTILERLVPIEQEVLGANGRHYVRRVLPYRTIDDRIDGVVITFIDVTERRLIEQELAVAKQKAELSVDRLRQLMNIPLVGVVILKPDGTLLEANDAFSAMTGYTNEDLATQSLNWRMLNPPRSIKNGEQPLDDLPRTGRTGPHEKEYLRKDGSRSWMLFAGAAMPDETIIEYCIDVADRKRADQAIHDRDAQLQLVVEGARDFAIIALDPDRKITSWNIGAERLIGYSESQALGQPGDIIFTPEDRAAGAPEREMNQAIANGRAMDERWHLRKNGERFWGSGIMAALHNPDGTVRAFVKIMRDETRRKRAEENLQSSKDASDEANRVKDEFLAVLSHELRTPLSAILLWSKMLLGEKITDPRQLHEGLTAINNSAEAQKELIEDLLDLSRISSGQMRMQMREVDLANLIRDAIETISPAAEARGVTIRANFGKGLGTVRIDPDRIRQVIWNLLSNAVKFTPADGRVEIAVERKKNEIEMRVSDTGKGISAGFLPHIFERFAQAESSHTRSEGGLGLGLAIVKQLVELHGGTIEAQSAGLGKGSTFIVRLPLPRASAAAAANPEPRSAHARIADIKLAGLDALIVEDDAATRNALSLMLQNQQMTVRDADSVDRALAMFKEKLPDLIISDISLPNADGYSLIRAIRKQEQAAGHKRIPAIALTAFARETDPRLAIDAGFNMHLGKPIDADELIAAIREVFQSK